MNNTSVDGAVRSPHVSSARRMLPLVLFVAVLIFSCAGNVFLPSSVLADQVRSGVTASAVPAGGKKNARAVPSKNIAPPKRQSPLVAKELAELKERGISSVFGKRVISRKRTRMHKGIDVPGPRGSKVIAYNDGEVIFVGARNGYGKTVVVRQIDGREALYAHLSKYSVRVGDELKRGGHLGFVGRTGRATGFHLHFEIIDEGENLDPALHVWHSSELVAAPGDTDTTSRTGVAESNIGRVPSS